MQNDYLDTQIILNDDDLRVLPDTEISGQIIFTPKINLAVAELGYQVILELSGNIKSKNIILHSQIFFRNKQLKKGKNYNYNINFKVSQPCSYTGRNVSITWKVASTIELNTRSYLQLRNDYLEKNNLTHFHSINPNDLISEHEIIKVSESKFPYAVDLKSEVIKMSPIWEISIFAGVTFVVAVLVDFLDLQNQFKVVSITAILLFLMTLLPYLYKRNILNSIKVDTKPHGKNQFVVCLDVTRNWKRIQKIAVDYEVTEKVTDRRDQDSKTNYKSKIYSSPPIEKHKIKMDKSDILDFPEITYDFVFDFPKRNIPTSYSNYDLNIYWKINITVYFFGGLSSTFVKNITVKKENRVMNEE